MKTYGIVKSAKSARKHRRAGHIVQRRTYGGWAWAAIDPEKAAWALLLNGQSQEPCESAESYHARHPADETFGDGCCAATLTGWPESITIGHAYTARRRNAASKPVVVTGFIRKDGHTMVSWKQGDKTGCESPQAFAQRVNLT